jgi:hypothetical protein
MDGDHFGTMKILKNKEQSSRMDEELRLYMEI